MANMNVGNSGRGSVHVGMSGLIPSESSGSVHLLHPEPSEGFPIDGHPEICVLNTLQAEPRLPSVWLHSTWATFRSKKNLPYGVGVLLGNDSRAHYSVGCDSQL